MVTEDVEKCKEKKRLGLGLKDWLEICVVGDSGPWFLQGCVFLLGLEAAAS